MSQYQRIFLIASPSMQRTPAFVYASHLAKATGATLHLCVFDYSDTIAAVGLIDKALAGVAREAYIDVRRAWAQNEAKVLHEDGIQATGDAAWARPMAEEMLAQIAELIPDIVIKDAQHERVLKRVLLTPVDWQLLRLCPAPLLLVNSAAHDLPQRVIAALDPVRASPEDTDFNARIVHEALALSIQCNADLHLATAFNPMVATGVGAEGGGFSAELYTTLRDLHQANFVEAANHFGVPADHRHFVLGTPAFAIAELAGNCHADVVVVGTTYRKGLERLLLGSTAESILEQAPCNLLAIKPEGFKRHFDDYMRRSR